MSKGQHWKQYAEYSKSSLANISQDFFRIMIFQKSQLPMPYIISSVEINKFLYSINPEYHRKFREQFPGFDKVAILGVQLYRMLYPNWNYGKKIMSGHKYKVSCYWV